MSRKFFPSTLLRLTRGSSLRSRSWRQNLSKSCVVRSSSMSDKAFLMVLDPISHQEIPDFSPDWPNLHPSQPPPRKSRQEINGTWYLQELSGKKISIEINLHVFYFSNPPPLSLKDMLLIVRMYSTTLYFIVLIYIFINYIWTTSSIKCLNQPPHMGDHIIIAYCKFMIIYSIVQTFYSPKLKWQLAQ